MNPQIYPAYEYMLYFDGCSKGNPGLAGAGAVLYHFNTEVWSDSTFVGTRSTNNQAEYMGLIMGLIQAQQMGLKQLQVFGDSQLVINHMTGVYQCRSEQLSVLYFQAKELERSFDKIEFVHVLRKENKRADHLSNIAVDMFVKQSYAL